MCGIAGFSDRRKSCQEATLQKMIATLQHRGPDGYNIKYSENEVANVGIGHTRLSILDLSAAGNQPMNYKSLWITFNGEIYNFQEIKIELENLHHSFRSQSDTEVILHAFDEWGPNCLHKFIGMFSFVIFDEVKLQFFCARDRAGVKPFFYCLSQGSFSFASELKSLIQIPSFKKEINLISVSDFIKYGNVPTPNTIYQDCFKLAAGHFMVYDIASDNLSLKQYWNPESFYAGVPLEISFEEARKKTKELLISSCKYRLVSDVPVGVFLSGGFDSTCVTAILQNHSAERLKTFTIGVSDNKYDEAPFAKKIATHLGTEHHELYCTEREAFEMIELIPFHFDEPFGDYSAIPTMLVSRFASQQVKVAISADGGDELFGGYNKYLYYEAYAQRLKKIPTPLRKSSAAILNLFVPKTSTRLRKAAELLGDFSAENYYRLTRQELPDNLLHKLLKAPYTNFHDNILEKQDYNWLSQLQVSDYKTYLQDDILQKVDRSSMAFSIEAREPLLDHRLYEFLAKLPSDYKLKNGVTKRLLREITYDYVPKEMMQRPKMGFAFPIEKFLKYDYRSKLEYYFNEKRLKHQGIFDPTNTKNLLSDYLRGNNRYTLTVWNILMFQMWHEKWID